MIPKILHHVWPGEDAFRSEFHEWRAGWVRKHPDWSFFFWRLADPITAARVDDPAVAGVLQSKILSVTVKSDILRLYALKRYGGVYVDTDCECLRSFDDLLDHKCFSGFEVPDVAGPSVIGAEPNHQFIVEYLRRALERISSTDIYELNRETHKVTGPYLMTEVLKRFPDVVMYPHGMFYAPDGPDSRSRHHFNGQTDQGWRKRVILGRPEGMRLGVLHSPHPRCGVREYGMQLDRALAAAGMVIDQFTFAEIDRLDTWAKPEDRLLVHFEPGLTQVERFMEWLYVLKDRGVRIVFCCHWYERRHLGQYDGVVKQFVTHRVYPDAANYTLIPLGCPTYTPGVTRSLLRRHLGLPEDKVVVTTLGFLSEWKRFPEIVPLVLDRLPPSVFLQIQTPIPFHGDPTGEERKLRSALTRFDPARYRLSTEFVPESELLNRVHASDLGFLYHDRDTGSVSAATKQFVSARCPLVTTDSTHDMDLLHVRRAPKDMDVFVSEVARLALDPSSLGMMRRGMEVEYKRINMDAVAQQYVDLFQRLS